VLRSLRWGTRRCCAEPSRAASLSRSAGKPWLAALRGTDKLCWHKARGAAGGGLGRGLACSAASVLTTAREPRRALPGGAAAWGQPLRRAAQGPAPARAATAAAAAVAAARAAAAAVAVARRAALAGRCAQHCRTPAWRSRWRRRRRHPHTRHPRAHAVPPAQPHTRALVSSPSLTGRCGARRAAARRAGGQRGGVPGRVRLCTG
jgi:hypothetical protein